MSLLGLAKPKRLARITHSSGHVGSLLHETLREISATTSIDFVICTKVDGVQRKIYDINMLKEGYDG